MGQHQRTLEVFQVFAGNFCRSQQTKTGIDAVGGAVLGKDLLDAGHAGINLRRSAFVQTEGYRLLVDFTQLGKAQLAGDQV